MLITVENPGRMLLNSQTHSLCIANIIIPRRWINPDASWFILFHEHVCSIAHTCGAEISPLEKFEYESSRWVPMLCGEWGGECEVESVRWRVVESCTMPLDWLASYNSGRGWQEGLGQGIYEYGTVFGSAYCTIAATSAENSTKGFLNPRSPVEYMRVPNISDAPLYICEHIDNFHRDVEVGLLNQRAWVLQERALSRRTIHFTTRQTYWEFGRGVHCESLIAMFK